MKTTVDITDALLEAAWKTVARERRHCMLWSNLVYGKCSRRGNVVGISAAQGECSVTGFAFRSEDACVVAGMRDGVQRVRQVIAIDINGFPKLTTTKPLVA